MRDTGKAKLIANKDEDVGNVGVRDGVLAQWSIEGEFQSTQGKDMKE
jgi:hypothetical protein